MQTLEPILANHPFFQGVEPRYMQLIIGCASNVRFPARSFIFREGEPASTFYIVRHGKVALEILAAQPGGRVIQTIEDGDVLGWSWLFPPYRWHFSARVIEETRAIALDGVCLREKAEADHNFGFELMKRVAQIMVDRLQAARLQMLDIYGAQSGGLGE